MMVVQQQEDGQDLPAYLRAERAAAILARGQYRALTEDDIEHARGHLEAALAAVDAVRPCPETNHDQLHLPI